METNSGRLMSGKDTMAWPGAKPGRRSQRPASIPLTVRRKIRPARCGLNRPVLRPSRATWQSRGRGELARDSISAQGIVNEDAIPPAPGGLHGLVRLGHER
jgi:hypothetical protein